MVVQSESPRMFSFPQQRPQAAHPLREVCRGGRDRRVGDGDSDDHDQLHRHAQRLCEAAPLRVPVARTGEYLCWRHVVREGLRGVIVCEEPHLVLGGGSGGRGGKRCRRGSARGGEGRGSESGGRNRDGGRGRDHEQHRGGSSRRRRGRRGQDSRCGRSGCWRRRRGEDHEVGDVGGCRGGGGRGEAAGDVLAEVAHRNVRTDVPHAHDNRFVGRVRYVKFPLLIGLLL
mmetsp:Transcript_7223/g.17505  ORF Transcript_7223/g.17505 Transcript_7223/m.17505 type:complete len:229 (+) Transcript_7223:1699-2385(+)